MLVMAIALIVTAFLVLVISAEVSDKEEKN